MKITDKTIPVLFALFALFASAESTAQTAGAIRAKDAVGRRTETQAQAQQEFKFRTLSPPGGFSFDGVDDIAKDGDGFVWLLLGSDLIRFDGYEYKHYYSCFQDEGIDSRLLFHNIVTDSAGKLYVSCAQGLFRYDRLTDSFVRLLDRSYIMFVDAHDNVYTSQYGRFGIVHGTDSFEELSYDGRPIHNVRTVETGADGSFFVASGNHILRYDHSSGTFSSFHLLPDGYQIAKMRCSGNKLWVLSFRHGLAVMDIPSQEIESEYDFVLQYDGLRMELRDMLVDKYGRIWIATHQGLWFFDPRTMERRMYRHSDSDILSIPNNSVRTVTNDPEGNIWIGTYTGGVCMIDPDESKIFTTYVPQPGGLNHGTVSAFAEDEHVLWIGTEGGGVNRLDRRTGNFTHIIPKIPGVGISPPGNHIKSLVYDGAHRLWIATFLGGLMCYDIHRGTFDYFNNQSPAESRLLANDLRRIIPEGDRGLWIAYQNPVHAVSFLPYDGSGIEHFKFDTGGLSRYNMDVCRSGDYLWIVTQQSLYRLDVRTRKMVNVSSDKIDFMNAQSLCADAQGNVWVGTVSGILLRYDTGTGEFTTITGLADYNASSVYSLCFDGDGNLWMGTDNGLFRYVPGRGKFTMFDKSDGTQGNMYYPLSSMLTASGRLIFGGTNGFSIVDPRAAGESGHVPKAIISDFTVNNVPTVPRYGDPAQETFYGREIVLSHRETGFGFRLASDNYATPSKTRFRYRLEGYDTEPVVTDGRTVAYPNMRAGSYRFEVSASKDGETWSDPVGVEIVRRPAPWNSRVAWVLYCTALLAVAATITYYYMERRRLAMQLYLDGLDKQKKEELHQSQLRFFTNISHDLRTPLSLILGAVDNLGRRGAGRTGGSDDKYYNVVSRNSQRLLGLVNELMDFRTVENGMMRLQVQPLEINRLVRNISADFIDFAREKSIDFRVECDDELSTLVPADRSVVEKIVMNLLNNAFKYTSPGGAITISTHASGHDFRNRYDNFHRIAAGSDGFRHFTIAVGDTGVGISPESISKVFARFYKVSTATGESHLGTGIGLALVKSLVLLHRGAITIFSERGKGTDMVVELPFDSSAYAPGEFLVGEDLPNTEFSDKWGDNEKSAAESMLMRTRKTVLIVEDNDELRMLIADFLSSEYEVVQAADGMMASEWLAGNDTDLVIADIMMPGMDGVTLCREVKGDVATSHIPFILLTAKTDIASKLEGTVSGADLYFEKPVDLNLLSLSIGNIFSRQNALREYYSKNHFVGSSELSQNEHDNIFLKKLIDTIERNLTEPVIDVNFVASELSMSRRKLYSKVKALTGKSIVEFTLSYRMRKAARLIIEKDMSMRQVMEIIGIHSQSYFTNAFKKEFGETPSAFAKSQGKRPSAEDAENR